MLKFSLNLILKTILISILFLFLYYLFILKPKLVLQKSLILAEKQLSAHYFILVQNRLVYVELTRLDQKSANFDIEKSNIIGTLKKTNEEGLKLIESEKTLPKLDKKLNDRFPALLEETKSVYQDQNKLLEKIFATKSYEEGVTILRSDEAVKLLVRQTNLILEYDFWLNRIRIMK